MTWYISVKTRIAGKRALRLEERVGWKRKRRIGVVDVGISMWDSWISIVVLWVWLRWIEDGVSDWFCGVVCAA